MKSFIFILLTVFVIIVITIALKKITNSKAFRLRQSIREYQKHKKNEHKFHMQMQKDLSEVIKEENKIIEIIRKIRNKEEVEIDLIAFDYIYRNIDQISVVNSDGKIVITNEVLLQKAESLLEKNNESNSQRFFHEVENDNPYSYQSFEKDKDGTIIKIDKINNTETIIKPDGKKYILNKTTHELIVASVKEKENNKEDKRDSKGENNSKPTEEAKEKNDIKKLT